MSKLDITKRPERKLNDTIHTIAKAGLSAMPCVGGPASELFSLVITPSLEKRRNEWIESIAKNLKALEDKVENFKVENLRKNESFISTVMQASQAAIRSHQKHKLEALQNAVLNAAMPNAPEQDLQLMFLNFIDSLTSWHLRMLKTFNDYMKHVNLEIGIQECVLNLLTNLHKPYPFKRFSLILEIFRIFTTKFLKTCAYGDSLNIV